VTAWPHRREGRREAPGRTRLVALSLIVLASVAGMSLLPPVVQPASYHDFADQRTLFGIPRFADVATNLAFLAVGLTGLVPCIRERQPEAPWSWRVFFLGVILVGAGSTVYHRDPTDLTLVWDRLAMASAFMALAVAFTSEYVDARLERLLLVPAVALGIGSVLYWHYMGDLRAYLWVQFFPLLYLPALMLLFRSRYTRQWYLLPAFACYLLAKLAELYDRPLFVLTGERLSGHSLKHLLAALGICCLVLMLERRAPRAGE
jgi:hypothetical protein